MTDTVKEDIYSAIFNVQQQAEYIKRDKKADITTTSGSKYGYSYADLTSTWDAIKQLLKDNNVVVLSAPSSTNGEGHSGSFFKQTLRHLPSNTEVTDYVQLVTTRQDPQTLGAAITFYRRYMLTSKLGLIPDDDNDAREHRLATAQQKLQIVGAVKMTFDNEGKEWRPEDINSTIENIIGKHPSTIRESEADNVIELIKAYKA